GQRLGVVSLLSEILPIGGGQLERLFAAAPRRGDDALQIGADRRRRRDGAGRDGAFLRERGGAEGDNDRENSNGDGADRLWHAGIMSWLGSRRSVTARFWVESARLLRDSRRSLNDRDHVALRRQTGAGSRVREAVRSGRGVDGAEPQYALLPRDVLSPGPES